MFQEGRPNGMMLAAVPRESTLGTDPVYAKNVKARLSGPSIQAPTRYVVREASSLLIRDKRSPMTSNDWADFGHMVVAVSYADYVLLDRGWTSRALQVRDRLRRAGLCSRFAGVYSPRTLKEFWKAFDT